MLLTSCNNNRNTKAPRLETMNDTLSWAMGENIGMTLKEFGNVLELDNELVQKAIRHTLNGGAQPLDEAAFREAMSVILYEQQAEMMQRDNQNEAQINRQQEAYFAQLVSEHPNVITRGEGLYNEGDSAEIFIQYLGADSIFSHWNDSLRDNPHSFVVTQDTTFVAHFKPRRAPTSVSSPDAPAPFTLSPNPAHTSVTVTLAAPCGPGCSLSLIDASGHTVLSLPLPAGSSNATLPLRDLPAGPYVVSLSSPQGSSSQKLILQ